MIKKISMALALFLTTTASGYTSPPPQPKKCSSRKAFLQTCTSTLATAAFLQTSAPAQAFDGAGSSAYSGKAPASKAELKKSYQNRVIADVKDFKRLGAAIDNGQTDGDAWVAFFIEFQRREPDAVGRTYAALVDLVGGKDISGCGVLLAGSYAKPGKPSDGLPSVKKYNAMAKVFEPIKAAGKKGDAGKAKVAWGKAKDAIQEYLETVELPSSQKVSKDKLTTLVTLTK
jgi:hypothetical protein